SVSSCTTSREADNTPLSGSISFHSFVIVSDNGVIDCIGNDISRMTFLCDPTKSYPNGRPLTGRVHLDLDSSGNIVSATAYFSTGSIRAVNFEADRIHGLNYRKMRDFGPGSPSSSYPGNCAVD